MKKLGIMLAMLVCVFASCSGGGGEESVNSTLESAKLAYSTDEEELEGWSAGLFDGEGTYVMGKPHGDNGYLILIGNIIDNESAIVYMDASKQLREIFIDNTIITLGETINGGIDVSIFEKGGMETIERITYDGRAQSRSSNDHSQLVGMINLVSNLDGMSEAVSEMIDAKNFSKKGAIMFLANKTDAIRNTVLTLGGPDIFNETFSAWLGDGMNFSSLIELGAMYGTATLGGAVGACILSYAGLISTYFELYDEHIEPYYGNAIASIDNIRYENNELKIDLKVTGYEYLYNLECGVIVKQSNLPMAPPAGRFPSDVELQTVTQDGSYSFSVSDIEKDKSYWCYPFLISKSRDSLWKGYIGDFAGPLVRYGKAVKYPYNIVGKWKDGCDPPCIYIFNEDGSGSHYELDYHVFDFSWKLENNNILTIEHVDSDGEKDVDTVEIGWINNNKFIYEVEYTRVQ